MTNGECETILDHAIAVAEHHAASDIERESLERLRERRQAFFSGYCPNLDELFPTMEEQQFWARCFRDAAKWLHEGKLKYPSDSGASPAVWIYYAYAVSNLMTGGFELQDEDSVLRRKFHQQVLEEYAARREQRLADVERKRSWLADYGAKSGMDVPSVFERRSIDRYLMVRLDSEPARMVGKTWAEEEQVIRYLSGTLKPQFGEDLSELVEVIDLEESVRLTWSEQGGLRIVGALDS